MDVPVSKLKAQFAKLILAVENGERVVITRNGVPIAEMRPPQKVQLGAMRGRIKFLPGWNDPIDEDDFLEEQGLD